MEGFCLIGIMKFERDVWLSLFIHMTHENRYGTQLLWLDTIDLETNTIDLGTLTPQDNSVSISNIFLSF